LSRKPDRAAATPTGPALWDHRSADRPTIRPLFR
jgi:hypothetical protein